MFRAHIHLRQSLWHITLYDTALNNHFSKLAFFSKMSEKLKRILTTIYSNQLYKKSHKFLRNEPKLGGGQNLLVPGVGGIDEMFLKKGMTPLIRYAIKNHDPVSGYGKEWPCN